VHISLWSSMCSYTLGKQGKVYGHQCAAIH
jgi:hypothetical protein